MCYQPPLAPPPPKPPPPKPPKPPPLLPPPKPPPPKPPPRLPPAIPLSKVHHKRFELPLLPTTWPPPLPPPPLEISINKTIKMITIAPIGIPVPSSSFLGFALYSPLV